jgi:hypothetical protein
VGPSSVVEVEIAADRLLRLADAVVGALAVHADGNVVLDQDARKIGAGAIDPAGWREVVCAENRNEYYNNKESDVPHADKAGFLSGMFTVSQISPLRGWWHRCLATRASRQALGECDG